MSETLELRFIGNIVIWSQVNPYSVSDRLAQVNGVYLSCSHSRTKLYQ